MGSILVLGGAGTISERPNGKLKSVLLGPQFIKFVHFEPLLSRALL